MAANTASVDALLQALYRSPLGGTSPVPIVPVRPGPYQPGSGSQGESGPRGLISQQVMHLQGGGAGGGGRGTPALASGLAALGGALSSGIDAFKASSDRNALADAYGAGAFPALPSFDVSSTAGPTAALDAPATTAENDGKSTTQSDQDPAQSDYISRLASIENPSGNSRATSPTGATGQFQFLPSTWAKYGGGGDIHGDQTAALERFTADNADALRKSLGREPTAGELYLAHQQGAWGAGRLLANPDAAPADLGLGRAVAVNGGDPNAPASHFTSKWTSKFAGIQSPFAEAQSTAQASPVQLAGAIPSEGAVTHTPPSRPDMANVPVPTSGPYGAPASILGGPVQTGDYRGQAYQYQTQPAISEDVGLGAAGRGVARPGPAGRGGAGLGEAWQGAGAQAPASPLAAGLFGGALSDGAGGYVPITNSRIGSDGSLLPANAALARGLDQRIAPSAPPSTQIAQLAPPSGGAPATGSPDVAAAPGQPGPPSVAAPVPGPAIAVPGYEGKFTRAQANDAEGVPSAAEWDAAAKAGGAPAASASAPTPSGQPAPTPAAATQAVGDKRLSFLKQEHSTAEQGFAQMTALAQRALRSGPGHEAESNWYMQQAAAYRAVGQHIVEEAYKTIPAPPVTVKPGEHVLNQQGQYYVPVPAENTTRLATAADMPAGSPPDAYKGYQIKDGELEPIKPIPSPETDSVIKEYEYYTKNFVPDAQHLKPVPFNDFRLEKTQGALPAQSIMGADGQPIDESKIGDGPQVLSLVPPDVSRMALGMIEGRNPVPNLSVRTDPVTRQAVLTAQKADPSLDVGNSTARVKVRNEFLAGGLASPAGRMTAGNNAINHLDEANYYAQELHDLGYDNLNAIWNAVTPGSSAVGKALSGYKTAISNAAGEVVKFNTGSEGALQDRQEKAEQLGPNLTFGGRKTALESQVGILASNMVSLQKRWRDGMGPLVPDFETIHPDALAAIERIKGNQPYPPPGGLPPSMREGAMSPNNAPSPSTFKVSPYGGGEPRSSASADPMAAARAAIAAGAPREAVIQRLKQNGINPAGL